MFNKNIGGTKINFRIALKTRSQKKGSMYECLCTLLFSFLILVWLVVVAVSADEESIRTKWMWIEQQLLHKLRDKHEDVCEYTLL